MMKDLLSKNLPVQFTINKSKYIQGDIPGYKNTDTGFIIEFKFDAEKLSKDNNFKALMNKYNIKYNRYKNAIKDAKIRIFGKAPFCNGYNELLKEGYLPLVEQKCAINECCTLGNKIIGIKLPLTEFDDIVEDKLNKDKSNTIESIEKGIKILQNTNDLSNNTTQLYPGIVTFEHIGDGINEIIKLKNINNINVNNDENNRQYYNDLFTIQKQNARYSNNKVTGYNDYFINTLAAISGRDTGSILKRKRYLDRLATKKDKINDLDNELLKYYSKNKTSSDIYDHQFSLLPDILKILPDFEENIKDKKLLKKIKDYLNNEVLNRLQENKKDIYKARMFDEQFKEDKKRPGHLLVQTNPNDIKELYKLKYEKDPSIDQELLGNVNYMNNKYTKKKDYIYDSSIPI